MKIKNFLLKTIFFNELLVRVILFILGSILVLLIAYILGWDYLTAFRGNDSMHAFSFVKWFGRWWPKIPFWYPGQGSGVSVTWGYPILPSLMVIILSLLAKINHFSAFKILGFLSVPVTSIGIYLFVWRRFKNQTAGIIAAIFHLLMPISWVWLFDWGFYAEHLAYFFAFPALLFYDRLLDGFINKDYGITTRTSLLLAVLLSAITFTAHPIVFFSILRIIIFYSPICYLIKKKLSLRNLIVSVSFPLIFFAIAVLGASFLTLSYNFYSKSAAWMNTSTINSKEEFVYFYSVPFKAFIGIGTIPGDDFKYTIRNASIPPLVWSFAVLGTVFAFFISAKLVGFALAGWFAFLTLYYPTFLYYLTYAKIPFFNYFFTMRTDIVVVKFMLPILAGFGIWGIPGLILRLMTFWLKFKNEFLQWFINTFRGAIAAIMGLGLAAYAIFYFTNVPTYLWKDAEARYGPYSFDIRDPFNKYQLANKCMREASNTCRSLAKTTRDKEGFITYLCSNLEERGQGVSICKPFLEKAYKAQEMLTPLIFSCDQGLADADESQLCPPKERGDRERYVWNSCQNLKEKGVASEFCSAYLDLSASLEKNINDISSSCEIGNLKDEELQLCPFVAETKFKAFAYLLKNLKIKDYWPRMDFSADFEVPFAFIKDFNEKYGHDQFLRLDVSPNLGGITQTLNMVSQASMINLYTVQINLLGPYWAHEQQVLFSENDGRIETKNEVAKWFGTRFLLMNNGADSTHLYKASNDWVVIQEGPGNMIVEQKNSPKLWTLTQGKPTILVVSSKKLRAFEPLFRASNKGALPYDNFWLINGKETMDDYSLSELKQFEVIMLFGHKYKNRSKAYRLLRDYLKAGGSLFISAGWQYNDADWEIERAPDFFPAGKSEWVANFTEQSMYEFNQDFAQDLDLSNFGPLIWNKTGWGVSLFSDLEPWAKAVLQVDGKPLIVAGEYEKGRVVLSGLNLIGHMHSFDYNSSETQLMNRIFTWLREPQVTDLSNIVSAKRDNPDKIEFSFSESRKDLDFYFRESFFPTWKANLKSPSKKNIPLTIYKAGPGYKFMHLASVEPGSILTLEFKPGLRYTIWIALTLLIYLTFIFYVVKGGKVHQATFRLKDIVFKRIGSAAKNILKNWNKEEDY